MSDRYAARYCAKRLEEKTGQLRAELAYPDPHGAAIAAFVSAVDGLKDVPPEAVAAEWAVIADARHTLARVISRAARAS